MVKFWLGKKGQFITNDCYFLIFSVIITLHDRTGRLENAPPQRTFTPSLHDRTGRLEMLLDSATAYSSLHDRTGRLEKEVGWHKTLSNLHDRTGRLEIISYHA